MSTTVKRFEIEGPLLLEGTRHYDERGFFSETYQKENFDEIGLPEFVQDNLSVSKRGVFRGLHWQDDPFGQGKLVTCLAGSIIDFVVDVRRESPTFMEKLAVSLDSKELKSLWVPKGFAHGFLSMEDGTLITYKVSALWNKSSERSLSPRVLELENYVNPEILIISKKDAEAPLTI